MDKVAYKVIRVLHNDTDPECIYIIPSGFPNEYHVIHESPHEVEHHHLSLEDIKSRYNIELDVSDPENIETFHNVGQLKRSLINIPDERYVVAQTITNDGKVYNMVPSFCRQVPQGTISCLTLEHKDFGANHIGSDMRAIASEIIGMGNCIHDSMTLSDVYGMFYDICRKYGIKQGTKTECGTGVLHNNPEWTMVYALFSDTLKSYKDFDLILNGPPEDLIC